MPVVQPLNLVHAAQLAGGPLLHPPKLEHGQTPGHPWALVDPLLEDDPCHVRRQRWALRPSSVGCLYDSAVSARPTSLSPLTLPLAALLGASVGGASHLSAVDATESMPSRLPRPMATQTAFPTDTQPPEVQAIATPSTAATQSTAAQPGVWFYTVEVGDTMSGIAIRFGMTTEELLARNPEYEDNVNIVEAGSILIVPCTPIPATENRC